MKKLFFIVSVSILCVLLVSCEFLNDDDEENPDYPFLVRPYKSNAARGGDYYDPVVYTYDPGDGLSNGTGFLRFSAKNIGDEKLCSVTCTVTATSNTGYTRADVAWELVAGTSQMENLDWVQEEWDTGKEFYGLAIFNDMSDEELDFSYSFSWAGCVDESDTNLGGLVAPPRQ